MPDWDALAEGFRFDLWANLLWLECLDRKTAGDPDRRAFAHLLSAQQIWLLRVQGTSLSAFPVVEQTPEALTELNAGWLRALAGVTEDRVVEYRRTNGDANSSLLSEIALHVVNHGTYHRGELRGLRRARNDDDFPETDRILFSMLRNP